MKLELSKEVICQIVKKAQVLIAVLTVFLFVTIESKAQEQDKVNEIVVLLDCSKSMEDVDEQYLVFDFVKGLSAAIPRNYKIGIVAYNDDICTSLPLGSGYAMIDDALKNIEYKHYGNAGVGLKEAVELFSDEQTGKKIIWISDGEILMGSEEKTEESVKTYCQSVVLARERAIEVDVIALGDCIEEGYTIYPTAEETNGQLYELTDSDRLNEYIGKYLFDEWRINESHVGKVNGTSGELEVKLPDCYMETAKIVLLGKQQNENLSVNCEAEKINVLKGKKFTVIELTKPGSQEVKIQTLSETAMDIDAYLLSEYDFEITTGHTYIPETQTAEIWMMLTNRAGNNLLAGQLKDGGIKVYLDDKERVYEIVDGKAIIEEKYQSGGIAKLKISFEGANGNYYGAVRAEEKIVVPIIEEPEQIDWFFWTVIIVFVISITLIFYVAAKRKRTVNTGKRVVDESRALPKEKGMHRNDFYGKIQMFVIRNKENIDFPPESINLFARCNREMITLEWLLDACNLPLDVKGAERIIIKPGVDKSLIIKNNSKATALKGREFLIKGQSYHLYYHEKVTFIFDEEDTEIEVHYKDLKPNER